MLADRLDGRRATRVAAEAIALTERPGTHKLGDEVRAFAAHALDDRFPGIDLCLTRRRSRARVTISATIALTARWLVPRVAAFRALHPDVDLQLQASDDVVNFDAAGVDIAIRYGGGPFSTLC